MFGIAACVPTLMTTSSPESRRVPPSFSATSIVFGPTKRPLPMMSSAPLVSVGAKVKFDLTIDHVLLAAANLPHVGLDRIGQRAELRRVLDQVGDPGAPEFVLGRQTGDGGTGAADPATLHDGDRLA